MERSLAEDFEALWDSGGPPDEEELRHFTHRLFEARKRSIFLLCYRLAGNYDDAEDLCIEAFERAYAAWRLMALPPRTVALDGFLRRIAANLWRNLLRTKHNRPTLPLPTEDWEESEFALPTAFGLDPATLFNDKEALEVIRALIAELSPREQAVLGQRYEQGLDDAEIAVNLGLTRSNVRQIRNRALARVRQRLQALGLMGEAPQRGTDDERRAVGYPARRDDEPPGGGGPVP